MPQSPNAAPNPQDRLLEDALEAARQQITIATGEDPSLHRDSPDIVGVMILGGIALTEHIADYSSETLVKSPRIGVFVRNNGSSVISAEVTLANEEDGATRYTSSIRQGEAYSATDGTIITRFDSDGAFVSEEFSSDIIFAKWAVIASAYKIKDAFIDPEAELKRLHALPNIQIDFITDPNSL